MWGVKAKAGISIPDARGDDGILREGSRLCSASESVLAMGLRYGIVTTELRRLLSLPERLASSSGGGWRSIRGRGSVSGAASVSGGGGTADTGTLRMCSPMAAIASPLGKAVEESLRTRVGARPRPWITVTCSSDVKGLIISGGGRPFLAVLGERVDGLDGTTLVRREADSLGSGSGLDRAKGRRNIICERRCDIEVSTRVGLEICSRRPETRSLRVPERNSRPFSESKMMNSSRLSGLDSMASDRE